jgi:methyl-accepting chemotaxis protein
VQSSATTAISEIEQIAVVVKDVSDLVISIATAVEEQSTVARDLASNIMQASAGLQDTSRRVSETASVSTSDREDPHDLGRAFQAQPDRLNPASPRFRRRR